MAAVGFMPSILVMVIRLQVLDDPSYLLDGDWRPPLPHKSVADYVKEVKKKRRFESHVDSHLGLFITTLTDAIMQLMKPIPDSGDDSIFKSTGALIHLTAPSPHHFVKSILMLTVDFISLMPPILDSSAGALVYTLLLDEADVFLAERRREDFNRNGLVAEGNKRPYLVMNYSNIGTLAHFAQNRSLDLIERRLLARDVAMAIRALHDCNIIHGDVNPENVLVFDYATKMRTMSPTIPAMSGTIMMGFKGPVDST
ncbi:hypothetical protein EDB80DRAFT_869590 [Ilyonectria destructans]|nr:hypothetical protein EDB80DRAFT_869590 [Ilyonectria destructans]